MNVSDEVETHFARTNAESTIDPTAASASRKHDYQLGYRGDIEGLRAVAILLVIADHAGFTWLQGGFVGVDVFFVLSGYLITALLVRDAGRNGHIRFANFYARRFRRLLPALLLMLACVSLLAIVLLAPSNQTVQAPTAASAALWTSNLRFAWAAFDYFGPKSENNLFLHTWSLGVEEQFYLIWPILLALVLGAWRGRRTTFNVARLKKAMVAIALISLIACVAWTPLAPQMAFYMMPSRAWQFALGALTLIYSNAPEHLASNDARALVASATGRTRSLVVWAGWVGFALILVAGVWFDSQVAYPGWRALLPSLGAAAVLAAGARAKDAGIARLLSWRPLQLIGRVSYSWYLWHWPVLILGGTLFALANPLDRLLLVGCSLLLAVLSFRLVETPIRRNDALIRRPGIFIGAAAGVMLVVGALAVGWGGLAEAWMNSPRQLAYRDAHTDAPVIYLPSMGCGDWVLNIEVNVCGFGKANAPHTAVLMGDSLAGQWFPAVAKAFDKPEWRVLVLTKSACPMVNRQIFYERIGREYAECDIWRSRALGYLRTIKPDVVILSSNVTSGFNRQQWVDGTSDILHAIGNTTGHIVLLRATPLLPFDGPDCLAMRQWRPAWLARLIDCRAAASSRQSANVYAWLAEAAAHFKNVSVLDMNDQVCPQRVCFAERQGRIVFRDDQHLTASFAESLAGKLADRLHARHIALASDP